MKMNWHEIMIEWKESLLLLLTLLSFLVIILTIYYELKWKTKISEYIRFWGKLRELLRTIYQCEWLLLMSHIGGFEISFKQNYCVVFLGVRDTFNSLSFFRRLRRSIQYSVDQFSIADLYFSKLSKYHNKRRNKLND